MVAPTVNSAGVIQYPPGYAPTYTPQPNLIPLPAGALDEVTFQGNVVTPEVIGADLANINIAFLHTLLTPVNVPPDVSITDAEDRKIADDFTRFTFSENDQTVLSRIGDTIGHVLGGTNPVGDFLAKLVTNELIIGNGSGFVSVSANLGHYQSSFYGPSSLEQGSVEHYLDKVFSGLAPESAYQQTLAESPFQLPNPTAA